MASNSKLFFNAKIFTNSNLIPGYLTVKDGLITKIESGNPDASFLQDFVLDDRIDCQEKLLLPGFIDAHVHFRDFSQSYKEDLESGSKAALSGGVTTVIAMPNTSPSLTNLKRINEYKLLNRDHYCNIGLYLRVAEEFTFPTPEELQSFSIKGIKIYPQDQCKVLPLEWPKELANDFTHQLFLDFIQSSLSQHENILNLDLFPSWIKLLKYAAENHLPLLFHPELLTSSQQFKTFFGKTSSQSPKENLKKDSENLDSNPHLIQHSIDHPIEGNERALVQFILKLLIELFPDPETAPMIYFCHVSSPDIVDTIRAVQNIRPYQIKIEVTPHHLFLNYEQPFLNENWAKVLVPLRSQATQQSLFSMLEKGLIDSIGTDHAPHSLEEKECNFAQAASGFPYIDFAPRILLSEVFNFRLSLQHLVQYFATNPAQIFNLPSKGRIAVGLDADLILVDRVEPYSLDPRTALSKQKWTPFAGRILNVVVDKVFLMGEMAYQQSDPCEYYALGQFI